MSVCNPCTQVKNIATCTQSIVLGTITITDDTVRVYFKNISTGLIFSLDAPSDISGNVTVDTSDIEFIENTPFEVWITEAGADPNEKQDITIGATTSQTICVRFDAIKNEAGEASIFATQTFSEA